MSPTIAAFGIGSTNFRFVAGTPTGGFQTEIQTEPTNAAELESRIFRAIDYLEGEAPGGLDAVSIAVTGLVDHETGTIRELDTADGHRRTEIPIAELITDRLGLPTHVENDCTASAIGEYVFGAGRAYDSVAHVTFGTGIGGGVVDDGDVLRGEDGFAAEVGLIPVQATGELESFGVRGAWEAYCSGRGLPTFVESLLRDEDRETCLSGLDELTAKDVFAAVDRGDRVARSYLDRVARLNAAGIGALANAYNPGLITVGGGVALNNRTTILDGIQRYLDDYCYVPAPDLQVTELGDYIGLHGALGALAEEAVSIPQAAVIAD